MSTVALTAAGFVLYAMPVLVLRLVQVAGQRGSEDLSVGCA